MIKSRRIITAISLVIPVGVFLILQSQGFGAFSIISVFQGSNLQEPSSQVRTGLMLAESGSNVYAAWTGGGNNQDIFFRASSDAGNSFDSAVNLSNNNGKSIMRSLTSKGSAVYALWVDDSYGNLDLFFRRSVDGGRSFGPVVDLSNTRGNSEFPVMDAEGPMVYVVWVDDTLGNDEIFFRHSEDAGATFSEVVNVSNNRGDSESPTVLSEGTNVYIVWHDNSSGSFNVYLRVSNDAGKTFGPTVNISNSRGNSGFAGIVADGSYAYVVWIDRTLGRQDVLLRYSEDAGATFSEVVNVSRSNAKSTLPTIDADGPLVCASWIDEDDDLQSLYISCNVDTDKFTEPVIITRSKNLRSNMVHVEGKDVKVIWLDRSSSINGIFFRSSDDRGKTFLPETNIAVGKISDVVVITKGTNVYALWGDKACIDEDCESVMINAYFNRSTDLGRTFESPMRLNR